MVSQYIDMYLDATEFKSITPGTFLNSRLHGRAKKYSSSYKTALINDLVRREALGDTMSTDSVLGGRAWVRAQVYHSERITSAASKGYSAIAHAVAACPVLYLQNILTEHPEVHKAILAMLEIDPGDPNEYLYCISVHNEAADIARCLSTLERL